jgi:hypothetical protein
MISTCWSLLAKMLRVGHCAAALLEFCFEECSLTLIGEGVVRNGV